MFISHFGRGRGHGGGTENKIVEVFEIEMQRNHICPNLDS